MISDDTIYALSSGSGRVAVSVIRISGSRAAALVESLAGRLPTPRQLVLRTITDRRQEEVLDRAMVVWLPGPGSFTGEDCAELHLHGSPAVISAVMQLLSAFPDVRPAEPGEFTLRAFVNGKLDLVEVEGIGDLLEARTAGQRRQALMQVCGKASSVFELWRKQLLAIRADIEAVVDFVEEPGIAEQAAPEIENKIVALRSDLQQELMRSRTSEILRDGVRVVLAGFPNTGKSSLLNSLVCREAAIVSDIPGTTRDAIEVILDLDGLPAIITDTAGLRNTGDHIELEGIRRTLQHVSNAHIVVWVWSPDVAGSQTDSLTRDPDLVILTKSDLLNERPILDRNDAIHIAVSTRTGEGLDGLILTLTKLMRDRYGTVESALLVSARQKQVAERLIRFLNEALEAEPDRLELKAESIGGACSEIARLTGRIEVEEWLGAIFSRFCVGK